MDERIVPFLKEHAIALVLGVAGLACLGYGLFSLSAAPTSGEGIEFESRGTAENSEAPAKKGKEVTVDVEGAVVKPGVYKLAADSRVQDALIAAGGLSSSADRRKVSQNINLAVPLTDSAKLYIPFVGEQTMTSGSESESSSGTGNSILGMSTKMVNINSASESELDALSGVGPVTAQKIIANRPYQKIDELVSKKAVGASVFSKIKDQISVF